MTRAEIFAIVVLLLLCQDDAVLCVHSDSAEACRKFQENRQDGPHADLLAYALRLIQHKRIQLQVLWVKAHVLENLFTWIYIRLCHCMP